MNLRSRATAVIESIRSSYWFVPSMMALGGLAGGRIVVGVDGWRIANELTFLTNYSMGFDEAGARALLTTVAGSMITVAGVVFSITILAMSLASQQYGPRMLGSFMRDRGNQIVLGTFLSTFLFCLISLPAVSRFGSNDAVPALTLLVALFLTGGSLAVLIYFIHHAAVSIQLQTILTETQQELDDGLDRLLERTDQWAGAPLAEGKVETPSDAVAVRARSCGYVARIDYQALLRLAEDNDCIISVRVTSGEFVADGDRLARLWRQPQRSDHSSGDTPSLIEQTASERLQVAATEASSAFVMSWDRSLDHNVDFALSQLIELAVRALSPGINDPFTAIQCIDIIAASLLPLLSRDWPHRLDDSSGVPRVLLADDGFHRLLATSWGRLRPHARDSLEVSRRLMERLSTFAQRAHRDADRRAIRRQAELVRAGAVDYLTGPEELEIIERLHRLLLLELGETGESSISDDEVAVKSTT